MARGTRCRRSAAVLLLLAAGALAAESCGGRRGAACGAEDDAAGLLQLRGRGGGAPGEGVDELVDELMAQIEKALPPGGAAAGKGVDPQKLRGQMLGSVRSMVVNLIKFVLPCTREVLDAAGEFLAECRFTDWAREQIRKEVGTWGGNVTVAPHVPAENFSKSTATVAWLYATATTCPMEQLERWPSGFDNRQCRYFAADGAAGAQVRPFQDHQEDFSKMVDLVSSLVAKALAKCTVVGEKWAKRWGRWAVKPLLSLLAKLFHGFVEKQFQGNKKGFVAVDKVLGAVVVSVSGTGIPGDPGFLDDYFADADFWWNLAGEKAAECAVGDVRLPGYYHPGFCLYYQKMLLYSSYADDLTTTVRENPGLDLLFTGHSLGGAAITIAAIDARHRLGFEPRRWLLYTFGSPRAGSPESAGYVNTHFDVAWRVTRKYDPVPLMVPCFPAAGIAGWSEVPAGQAACMPLERGPYHYGSEVYFPYDPYDPQPGFPPEVPEYRVCSGGGEDPACSASVPLKEFVCKAGAGDLAKLGEGFGIVHVDYMHNGLSEWCCAAA